MAEGYRRTGVSLGVLLLVVAGGGVSSAAGSSAVAWQDAYGDARATGDARAVQTSSVDDLDVLRMRFVAGARGVGIEMVLLGEAMPGAAYYGTLTDPTTGCVLRVLLNGEDAATAMCGGLPGAATAALPRTEDGRSSLRAVVPYRAFPRSIDPSRGLRVSGEAWQTLPLPPPPPPAPGSSSPPASVPRPVHGVDVARYDTAATGAVLGRRRR